MLDAATNFILYKKKFIFTHPPLSTGNRMVTHSKVCYENFAFYRQELNIREYLEIVINYSEKAAII